MAATIVVLAVLPALAYGADWTHAGINPSIAIEWPTAPAGWSGPKRVYGGEWKPQFYRPAGESLERYTQPNGQSIEVFAVAYQIQTQNAKLLSYWNHLLGNKGQLRSESERIVNSTSGEWRQMLVVDRAGLRSLIWSRYRVGSHLFVDPRLSQIWYGFEALTLRQPLTSLTALRANCTSDCKAARHRLRTAAAELRPTLR
jgi:EpsI family protein